MKPWKLLDAYSNWCYARWGKEKGFLVAMIPIWAVLIIYMVLLFSGTLGER